MAQKLKANLLKSDASSAGFTMSQNGSFNVERVQKEFNPATRDNRRRGGNQRRPRKENNPEIKFEPAEYDNETRHLPGIREGEGGEVPRIREDQGGKSNAKPYVSARCAIDPTDPLSLMLLMTASLASQVVVAIFILLPTILIALFLVWQLKGWTKEPEVVPGEEPVSPFQFYAPNNTNIAPAYRELHGNDVVVEYTIIFSIFICQMVPRAFSLIGSAKKFFAILSFLRMARSHRVRLLFNGFIAILCDKFVLPLSVWSLSFVIAFYTGTSLMGLLFRILWFEFLLNISVPLIGEYVKFMYPSKTMRLDILSVQFEPSFWQQSKTTESEVKKAFRETTEATSATLVLVTLRNAANGLGISGDGGTKGEWKVTVLTATKQSDEETLVKKED